MTTVVLVHGGWHGGWCWRKVAPPLRAAGHDVLTPTLTGLGERSHLATPETGLSTHVQDIVQTLHYEDVRDAILVGHSYGGMVISGVAEETPARLAHLVYLDAFVPEDSQALVDLLPPESRRRFTDMVENGDGWLLPRPAPAPWAEIVRAAWGVTDDADAAWLAERLGPHPYRTMTEPHRAGNPAAAAPPRTYVRCAAYPSPTFIPFAARARASGSGWRSREIASSHEAMITAPRELVAILLALAPEPRQSARRANEA